MQTRRSNGALNFKKQRQRLETPYKFDNGNVIGITNNRDTTRSQQFTHDQVNRLVTGETTSTYPSSSTNCRGEAYVYHNQPAGGEFGREVRSAGD